MIDIDREDKEAEARKVRVDHIAQIYYGMRDHDLVPWEQCSSRFRTQIRKQVRDLLYAVELADKETNDQFKAERK